VQFHAEFFADLDYDDKGGLMITREHPVRAAEAVAEQALRAVRDGVVISVGGKELPVRAETVCIHSDTPNVAEIGKAVRSALGEFMDAAW
jgi:5-oxoprolinase (ATP-hydrolysing) subunit A